MNPILSGRMLKEELKKTTTATPNGKADPVAEESFERDFAQWVISNSPEDDFYWLKSAHFTDEEGFIRFLQHDPENPWQKAVFQRLSQALKNRIPNHKKDKKLGEDLLEELNALLKGPPILPEESRAELGPIHKELLKSCQEKAMPVAVNRLCLECIFPRWILSVWDTVPLWMVHKWIHQQGDKIRHNALCLSGGGIRSATFGLGVLQGLAENEALSNLQYLSTVSGGGYIGSWLSAWIQREDFKSVEAALAPKSTPVKPAPVEMDPEPDEVSHLREYSNYLTPKLGIGSVDTWTLVGTYLRNLFLNWCVFIPALALALMVPRMCVGTCRSGMGNWLGYTAMILAFLGLLIPLVYAARHRPSSGKAKAQEAGQNRFLLCCFGPLFVASNCFSLLWAWLQHDQRNLFQAIFPRIQDTDSPVPWWPFVFLGAGSHVLAWAMYFFTLKKGLWREFFACLASGSVGGALLWVGAGLAHRGFNLYPGPELYVCFAGPWFLGSFLAGLFLFVGLSSHFTTDEDREWWARMSAWSLIAILAWALFSVLVLFGPIGLLKLPRLLTAIGGISGLVTLILSHSGVTAANRKEASDQGDQPSRSNIILTLVAPVFIACFVAALSLATTWVIKKNDPSQQWHNPAGLVAEDIKNFPGLAAKLKTRPDAETRNLWEKLPPGVREQILDYQATGTGLNETRGALARALNAIITNSVLQSLERDLSTGTNWMANRDNPTLPLAAQQVWQHNRFVLQSNFPELEQSDFDHGMITHFSNLRVLWGLVWRFFLVAAILSLAININRFSLHAIYRSRLIRAYLGASNRKRRPNVFTGFDPEDNLAMCDLKFKPFHVINMALNLVSGEKLAWQQRKAESFTASPLHVGNHWLGYRYVKDYASGSRHRQKRHDFNRRNTGEKGAGPRRSDRSFNLGTAVTISGAAASPNMGYHSSPVLAFIMTLFNVRLGAWFGNPGPSGRKSYRDKAPAFGFLHLVREAFGLTDAHDRYVYLSDGGHFENLGLYEMVLRRCRTIVVSDAGCDPNCALEDLGNAIRKIRIDLGIPIEVGDFFIASRKGSTSKYCAIGKIRYSAVDARYGGASDGTLIYIKPSISGQEPRDIYNYAEQSLQFPHEPTSDQWFSESQFESYRALGHHIIETMSSGDGQKLVPAVNDPLERFTKQAERYLQKASSGQLDLSKRQFSEVVLLGKAAITPDGRKQ